MREKYKGLLTLEGNVQTRMVLTFDGDEMSLYFPQNYEQLAEARNLAMSKFMIMAPHSILPIQAPQFNAVSALFLITNPDFLIPVEDFNDAYTMIQSSGKETVFNRGRAMGLTVQEMVFDPITGKMINVESEEMKELYRRFENDKEYIEFKNAKEEFMRDYVEKLLSKGKEEETKGKGKKKSIEQLKKELVKKNIKVRSFPYDIRSESRRYYPGRLLFSAILPEDFYYEKSSDGNDIRIVNGILLSHSLTGKTTSSSRGSIVQVLFNDYNEEVAANFNTDATYLGDWYYERYGISVGPRDFIAVSAKDLTNSNIKEIAKKLGIENISKKTIEELKKEIEDKGGKWEEMKSIQEAKNEVYSEMASAYIALGPEKDDPNEEQDRVKSMMEIFENYNNKVSKLAKQYQMPLSAFEIMKVSGAKGSEQQFRNILLSVGSQTVRGTLPPSDVDVGRSTVYAPKDSINPTSKGLSVRSYTQGMGVEEWGYHARSAREGLSDTATQTAEAGTIFTALIKSQENYTVTHFGDIRNGRNDIISFAYPFESRHMEFISKGKNSGFSIVDVKRMVGKLNAKHGMLADGTKIPKVNYEKRVMDDGTEREEGRIYMKTLTLEQMIEKVEEDTSVTITIKRNDGSEEKIEVDYYEPIIDIKKRLALQRGLPVEEAETMFFSYRGTEVENNKYISDYVKGMSIEDKFAISFNQGTVAIRSDVYGKGGQSELVREDTFDEEGNLLREEGQLVRAFTISGK